MRKLFLILLGVAAVGSLQALSCAAIGVDALYWHPCTPAFRYAIRETGTGTPNTRSKIRTVDGEYDWGFRVRAAYVVDCDTKVQVDYLYFQPVDSESTLANGATLRGPLNQPGFNRLTGRDRYTFHEANLRAWRAVWSGRCATLYGTVGVRWLDVRHRGRVNGSQPGSGLEVGDLWGVGAVVQAGLGYRLFRCLRLVGELGLAGLAGRRSLITNATDPASNAFVNINYGEEATCFPGLENRVFLKYSRSCGPFDVAAHIGWDQKYYLGAMKFGSLFTAAPDSSVETIGMNGLFFGFSAGY